MKTLNEMKCIWMGTGTVDYKLCDRGFACDECPFDRMIRNRKDLYAGEAVCKTVLQKIAEKVASEKYSKSIVFLPHHLSAKNLFSDKYYFGLDPLAYLLFDQITSFSVSESNSVCKKGETIVTVSGNWGSIPLPAPVSCMNLGSYDKSAQNNHRWFAMMEADPDAVKKSALCEEDFESERKRLVTLLEQYNPVAPEIGTTMFDGGSHVSFLYQLLGNNPYQNLLGAFLKL